MYYNIRITADNGVYSLDSFDKSVVQREMDLYFAALFGASVEFVTQIRYIKETDSKIKPQTTAGFANEKSTDEKLKENISEEEALMQPANDIIQKKQQIKIISVDNQIPAEKPACSNSSFVFKPIAAEEPVFKEDKANENSAAAVIFEDFAINSNENNELIFDGNILKTNTPIEEKCDNEVNPDEIIKEKNAPFIDVNFEKSTKNADNQDELKLIGLEDTDGKIEKEEKENNLNATIELAQHAVKNTDIESDMTFDADIPDAFTKKPDLINKVQLKTFGGKFQKEFDGDIHCGTRFNFAKNNFQSRIENPKNDTINSDEIYSKTDEIKETSENITKTENNENDNTEDNKEIASIFSDDNPFENPPESQNIIVSKEFQDDADRTMNLDFKTFLSKYSPKGIIDEFLICAYYVKHILGQHSFNMKYINSKIFQASGQIADLSVVKGLINSRFIKEFETDGSTRYSISSLGEEYFSTLYQR